MSVFQWSTTPATNATIDPQINLATSRAPSSVTPADRSTLAALAGYRMDISGAMLDTGVANAYLLTSASNYNQITGSQTALQTLGNNQIAFTPANTNTGTSTLSIDGLGPFPLRTAPNMELLAGTIIAGTPYVFLFNSTDSAFYLQNFYGNPLNIPLLAGMDFWDTIIPASNYIFPAGQAISRTVYSAAFARWGTTFGVGDGSTTFNVPDKRGRVSAMMEATATRLTTAGFGGNSTVLGAVQTLSGESETLTIAQMPSHSHTVNDPGHVHGIPQINNTGNQNFPAAGNAAAAPAATTSSNTTGITIQANGGGAAHPNVQPTIICNYILRII